MLGHHRVEPCFHFGTSEANWSQEDNIAKQQYNFRIRWVKIVDKTTWNISFIYMYRQTEGKYSTRNKFYL